MAESSRSKMDITPAGVSLVAGPSFGEEQLVNADLCIISQKKDKTAKTTKPGAEGKARLKRAASLRQDGVSKRLKLLEDQGMSFVYHNTNACYKSYTHKKALDVLETEMAEKDEFHEQVEGESEGDSRLVMLSRTKDMSGAQQDMEIAMMRGMPLEEIIAYDVLPCSPLFEGNLPRKPQKAQLMTSLEMHLDSHTDFSANSALKTELFIDFMSKIRQFTNLTSFRNFGELLAVITRYAKNVCHSEMIHMVFDSYQHFSIKSAERMRRTSEAAPIDLAVLDESVPIPQQHEKFWASASNKQNLQLLAHDVAQRDLPNVVVSGMVVNDEIIPALVKTSDGTVNEVSELTNWLEEADCRLVPHCWWAVQRGCQCVVVISNDTDTVMLLLRYITAMKESGLIELWVQYGTQEKRRFIPLHSLHEKLGSDLCRVLIKAHILTGNDCISKVGTKQAALQAKPVQFLSAFAEVSDISASGFALAEEYLVHVWAGSRSKTQSKTFDALRYEVRRTSSLPLDRLPPTSNVIAMHLRRAFYMVREAVTLLDAGTSPSPTDFGWAVEDDLLLPQQNLRSLPPSVLVTCNCTGKCNSRRCPCMAAGMKCVIHCHKKISPVICENVLE